MGQPWLSFFLLTLVMLTLAGTWTPASAGLSVQDFNSPILMATSPAGGSGGWQIYGIRSDAFSNLPEPVHVAIRGIFSVLFFFNGIDGDTMRLKWIPHQPLQTDGEIEEEVTHGTVPHENLVERTVTPIPFNTQTYHEDTEEDPSLPVSGAESGSGSQTGDETTHSYGGIYIASYPSGIPILLDGKSLGLSTPKVIFGLTEGLHTVRLDNNLKIFTVYEQKVWIYKGIMSRVEFDIDQEVKKTINVESKELYSGEQFTVNGKYPASRIPASVSLKKPKSFLTLFHNGSYLTREISDFLDTGSTMAILHNVDKYGTIRVLSKPDGADVLVDGFASGLKTPCIVENLSEGRHLIAISKLGYLPSEHAILIIDNPAADIDGEVETVLGPYIYGELSVNSTPEGAKVVIEKFNLRRTTPCTLPYMVIGSYSMKVTQGGTTKIVDLEIGPNIGKWIDFDFTKGTIVTKDYEIS